SLSLRYNNHGFVRPRIPDGMYLIRGGHRLYFADSHWEWAVGYSLRSLPQPDTLPESVPDLTNEIQISEFKPLGSERFVELWSPVLYSLDGWTLLAEGFHVFESTDIVDGCFVLREEDWDDGFDIGDSCGQLALLGPSMVCAKAFNWNGLSDTSVSGNALRHDAGWIDSTAWALPTPGFSTLNIREIGVPLPAAVSILSAQPNPFNDAASIGYEFAHGVTEAEIGVFDILGREVLSRRLSDTRPGYHETKIAALPSSGTYLVRIETNRGSDEMKITYLK
ncbi:MAG: T9SS type A sorting domain-containing protein, partial [bacterium]